MGLLGLSKGGITVFGQELQQTEVSQTAFLIISCLVTRCQLAYRYPPIYLCCVASTVWLFLLSLERATEEPSRIPRSVALPFVHPPICQIRRSRMSSTCMVTVVVGGGRIDIATIAERAADSCYCSLNDVCQLLSSVNFLIQRL